MSDAYDVFISYSRVNTAQARLITDKLQALGLNVFFDSEGIEVGAEFPEVIDRAVKNAKAVLGLWTQEAVQRRWVRIESRIALDRNTLVAAALAPMKLEELPAEFYNVNVVDLSTFKGEDSHPGWQAVLRAIGRKTARADIAPGTDVTTPAKAPGVFTSWKAKAAAALVVLALLGGGYFGASSLGLVGGAAVSTATLQRDLQKVIEIAQPILFASAETQINDIAKSPFPKVVWAAAQLVAAEPSVPDPLRKTYEGVITRLFAAQCSCLVIDGAESAIASAWLLLSFTEDGKEPPANVLRAVVTAQSPQGWWSAALDATPQSDHASLNITVMMVLALDQAIPLLKADDPRRAEAEQARNRALTWIRSNRPDGERLWADYPSNPRRTEHSVFSAMATIVLLAHGRGSERADFARNFVRSLKAVSAPDDSFSNNIIIALKKGGEPYVDTYRHVPMGWQIRALVAARPHLEGADRAAADALLASAFKMSLNVGRLTRQDWMLAEHVFGVRSALAEIKARPTQ
ncbi:hypothetical protein GJW-30_1_00921 [Variibacter gotjawalensis]|uniref:TIR domain-containing protein n=1 Tax=Variibacter gotjawalensis TaxID=1333996 RepID=A0A0S3PR90_9BRAD|nr:toll/interleukin-1 receptor domain-containing protein [Variibacter gotjawalensis]NIK48701.1 hypothetical protein [Variibacter gotjawalensis]RZS50562.1 TIR domain-containing protein [Variibacter gotjawalensis]BAT58396.1 hypothetical protein GJW-30_1_00921 [Variibacter gotjawalensis]